MTDYETVQSLSDLRSAITDLQRSLADLQGEHSDLVSRFENLIYALNKASDELKEAANV